MKAGSLACVEVFLNVYDLVIESTSMAKVNTVLIPLGFGAFRTGVQIYGREYCFSMTEGIYDVEPGQALEGAVFRKQLTMGTSSVTRPELKNLIAKLASSKYGKQNFNLYRRNWNHFSNDLCIDLVGQSLPRWINKLIKFSKYLNVIFPHRVTETDGLIDPSSSKDGTSTGDSILFLDCPELNPGSRAHSLPTKKAEKVAVTQTKSNSTKLSKSPRETLSHNDTSDDTSDDNEMLEEQLRELIDGGKIKDNVQGLPSPVRRPHTSINSSSHDGYKSPRGASGTPLSTSPDRGRCRVHDSKPGSRGTSPNTPRTSVESGSPSKRTSRLTANIGRDSSDGSGKAEGIEMSCHPTVNRKQRALTYSADNLSDANQLRGEWNDHERGQKSRSGSMKYTGGQGSLELKRDHSASELHDRTSGKRKLPRTNNTTFYDEHTEYQKKIPKRARTNETLATDGLSFRECVTNLKPRNFDASSSKKAVSSPALFPQIKVDAAVIPRTKSWQSSYTEEQNQVIQALKKKGLNFLDSLDPSNDLQLSPESEVAYRALTSDEEDLKRVIQLQHKRSLSSTEGNKAKNSMDALTIEDNGTEKQDEESDVIKIPQLTSDESADEEDISDESGDNDHEFSKNKQKKKEQLKSKDDDEINDNNEQEALTNSSKKTMLITTTPAFDTTEKATDPSPRTTSIEETSGSLKKPPFKKYPLLRQSITVAEMLAHLKEKNKENTTTSTTSTSPTATTTTSTTTTTATAIPSFIPSIPAITIPVPKAKRQRSKWAAAKFSLKPKDKDKDLLWPVIRAGIVLNFKEQHLEVHLRDPDGFKAFQAYLKSQVCEEALDFWAEVEKLRNLDDNVDPKDIILAIQKQFIGEKSVTPVNLQWQCVNQIEEDIKAEKFSRTIFDPATEVMLTLMDQNSMNYPDTPYFQEYIEAKMKDPSSLKIAGADFTGLHDLKEKEKEHRGRKLSNSFPFIGKSMFPSSDSSSANSSSVNTSATSTPSSSRSRNVTPVNAETSGKNLGKSYKLHSKPQPHARGASPPPPSLSPSLSPFRTSPSPSPSPSPSTSLTPSPRDALTNSGGVSLVDDSSGRNPKRAKSPHKSSGARKKDSKKELRLPDEELNCIEEDRGRELSEAVEGLPRKKISDGEEDIRAPAEKKSSKRSLKSALLGLVPNTASVQEKHESQEKLKLDLPEESRNIEKTSAPWRARNFLARGLSKESPRDQKSSVITSTVAFELDQDNRNLSRDKNVSSKRRKSSISRERHNLVTEDKSSKSSSE